MEGLLNVGGAFFDISLYIFVTQKQLFAKFNNIKQI